MRRFLSSVPAHLGLALTLGLGAQIMIAAAARAQDERAAPAPSASPPSASASQQRPAPAVVQGNAGDPWAPLISEASARFGVPERWLREVMRVESGGRTHLGGRPITSHAGAMGVMQVMPATYADLRARYGLGPDPYEPRSNVLAGAAYLREMFDRYRSPAATFAAYNAGPGRYDEYRLRGRPLPAETIEYLARLGPAVVGELPNSHTISAASLRLPDMLDEATVVASAPIFVRLGGGFAARQPQSRGATAASASAATPSIFVQSAGLFTGDPKSEATAKNTQPAGISTAGSERASAASVGPGLSRQPSSDRLFVRTSQQE